MTEKTNPTKNFLLPVEIRDVLLQYLFQRPYGEVAAGVAMLQGLSEAPEAPEAPEAKAQPGLRAVPEPSDYPSQEGAPALPPGLPTN